MNNTNSTPKYDESKENNKFLNTKIISISTTTNYTESDVNLKSSKRFNNSMDQQYSQIIQSKLNSSIMPVKVEQINEPKSNVLNINNLTTSSIFKSNNFESLNLTTSKLKNFQDINGRIAKHAGRYKHSNYNTQQLAIIQEVLANYSKKLTTDKAYHKILMGFYSGLTIKNKDSELDFQFYLNKVLQLSHSTNPNLNFFEKIFADLFRIINTELDLENGVFAKSTFLTVLLILRNLSQDSENLTYLIKNEMSSAIKSINKLLNHFLDKTNKDIDIKEESLRYSLDLLENIALFITNSNENDTKSHGTINELFKNILFVFDEYYQSQNTSILVPILATISRYITRIDSACENLISMNFVTKTISIILNKDNDSKLILAVLDFLQQYTANAKRFKFIFEDASIYDYYKSGLINLIKPAKNEYLRVNKLINNINDKKIVAESYSKNDGDKETAADDTDNNNKSSEDELALAKVPKHIYDQIFKLDEPERSKTFLRCLFEPSKKHEYPQIKLWKVYNDLFKEKIVADKREMISAINFIKSVPSVICGSSAIVKLDSNNNKKFVIEHLKPRKTCIDVDVANKSMDLLFEISRNNNTNNKNNSNKKIETTEVDKIDLTLKFDQEINDESIKISLYLFKELFKTSDTTRLNQLQVCMKGLIICNPSLISEFKEYL
ncbi:hypothetical protein HANVADRAFT_53649 [Hanseniaspora valbyensis NRRL Y-1626]|uniref:RFX-type winged-helix domain-containing protein n=1 Tax=Hanseniaspora valbyensis NRRL Y-1626 TaxID=766949 RepID=A0A1B7TAQ4_9ASCO|nr:hypothetical protein HANVADRAFT_53649 [Hanseniaspora valbyensis NRRL Y-1626]